ITGTWNRHRAQISVSQITFSHKEDDNRIEFEPVYSVKGDLKVSGLRRYIQLAFQQYGHLLNETLPEHFRTRYKLYSIYDAVRALHFPSGSFDLKQGRRRLVYKEFLIFQLKMQALRKFERENSKGISIKF